MARDYPDCFAPAPGRRPGAREELGPCAERAVVTTRGVPRTQPPAWREDLGFEPFRVHPPGLSMRPGTGRMRYSARAQGVCDSEVERYSIVETGALLFGRDHANLLDVADAVGAGPHAHRSADSFAFDPAWCSDRIAEMKKRGLQCVGEMHSHLIGPAIPSRSDIRIFEQMRELRAAPTATAWSCISATLEPASGSTVCSFAGTG